MNVKRLRIFAGPNGSGKSTFIRNFPTTSKRTLGYYVNADDIELLLKQKARLNLEEYGISSSTNELQEYFKQSTFAPVRLDNVDLWQHFSIDGTSLLISSSISINSYIAADIAEFIRQKLVQAGHSFSYETVMSDAKKIDFLRIAKQEGYRIYLYYIATDDPSINISRVGIRVAQNGHAVDSKVIEKRYYKSLENLRDAIIESDRAFLFDASGTLSILIAEITDGKHVKVIDPETVPNWFVKYVYKHS